MATLGLLKIMLLWNKGYDIINFIHDVTHKILSRDSNHIFDGCAWFKFHNLGLTVGMTLAFYTSVEKGLKLKVKKFWGLIPTFVEVTGKEWYRGLSPHLNRVKIYIF